MNSSHNLKVTLLLDSVFVPAAAADDADATDDAQLNYFHPLTNDATTGVSKADFMRFLDEIDHPPTILQM